MTFYGEWRRDFDSFASGYTYCQERLAKVDGNGTFKLRDLVEDADAYNIAMALRPGVSIAAELARTFQQGGHLTWLRRFWDGRFGGNGVTARAAARNMLESLADPVIVAGRAWLIETTGGIPTILPGQIGQDHSVSENSAQKSLRWRCLLHTRTLSKLLNCALCLHKGVVSRRLKRQPPATKQAWSLLERLTEADRLAIVDAYLAGTTVARLPARHDLSLCSLKRIVRSAKATRI